MVIVIRRVFNGNNKYYPYAVLGKRFHKAVEFI